MTKSHWFKSSKFRDATDEKVILKDHKSSVNNRIAESLPDADSFERSDSHSKFSKPSGPLSPINPHNIPKQAVKISPVKEQRSPKHRNDNQMSPGNELSDRLNQLSEHSLNDV